MPAELEWLTNREVIARLLAQRDAAVQLYDDLSTAFMRLADTLAAPDDLLRRLSEWDMLWLPKDGPSPTADALYWRREIDRVRTLLAEAAR